MANECSTLPDMIAEAREMQESGKYINGRIFHAMADEIDRLRRGHESIGVLVEEIERECMRDGGSYWLPAHQNKIEDWCGRLKSVSDGQTGK